MQSIYVRIYLFLVLQLKFVVAGHAMKNIWTCITFLDKESQKQKVEILKKINFRTTNNGAYRMA